MARSDDDIILRARVSGKSVAWIACEHGCSEEAVEAVLDQHATVLMTDKALRQALMLELKRLDDYVETFHPKAQESDPVCGALSRSASGGRPCSASTRRSGTRCRSSIAAGRRRS